MIQIINKKDCCGCTACLSVCPKKCINMEADEEGYLYPKVDTSICIECHLCEKVCPILNPVKLGSFEPKAYAVQHKVLSIRENSASGGAFSALAGCILEHGGVVYGGAFNSDFHVLHIRVESLTGLAELRGSKYVQSDMGEIFSLVKKDLKNGRMVMFSGTPCQIEGLVNSLGGLYPSNNLFLVDLVCHGIPSPLFWNKFVAHLSKKYGTLKFVSFRNKYFGYAGSTMAMKFEGGKMKYLDRDIQFYKKLFFDDINTRPSCFHCKFKTVKRISDFTIFDCWHVNEVSKKMDDDLGTTWVIVQSTKGSHFFETIKPSVNWTEASIETAINLDGQLAVNCTMPNPRREQFFKDMHKYEFDKLLEMYYPMTMKKRLINIVKPVFAKFGLIKLLKRLH